MEKYNVITIEKASKYGYGIDADMRRIELVETIPFIVKTKDIAEVLLLSDDNLNEHHPDNQDMIINFINQNLFRCFFLKMKEPIKNHYGNWVETRLIFGDFREFMKLMETGGNLPCG